MSPPLAVLATLSATTTAQAVGTGHEGCTPGYWKNHTDSWQEAAPGDLYGPVGADHVRIAVVQPDERLDLVAHRLGVTVGDVPHADEPSA